MNSRILAFVFSRPVLGRAPFRQGNYRMWNTSNEKKPGFGTFARLSTGLISETKLNNTDKHIILLSGGVDSSTVLHGLRSQIDTSLITAMFFQYGQRAAKQELAAVRYQCKQLNVTDLVEVDLEGLAKSLGSRRSDRMHVPLVHRNFILLAAATSLAGQEDVKNIWLAVTGDDAGWYPSAEKNFLQAASECVASLGDGICIHTPLLEMSKKQVIEYGLKLGVQFETTWSCMIGRSENHCGRCIQCRARKVSFSQCGIQEPNWFYRT